MDENDVGEEDEVFGDDWNQQISYQSEKTLVASQGDASGRIIDLTLQVPTPQVTMGACFVTVLHKSSINVNCCAQWYHPANRKQFMVLGAEQGVYALDLSDMSGEDEAPLVQLHERRCTWLYIVNDTITALQGKTPYLYRHDLLQLFQQELITQKLADKLQRLPEKFKPKALIGSIRMPETKDCYQCNVERSINDGELYLCCAVPNAVLLFRWYDPLTRFVWLKRVELDKLALPYLGPQHLHKPFNLIFGSGAANSDYPMVCIGISRALTSPVGTAQQLLNDLRNNKTYQKDRLELQFILITDLNGNQKKTDLMQTHFIFDSRLEYAIPLSDSVLGFHKHGIQI
uniref:CNH domain-containing protein n=1 Tax=Meloidogyne javanica TaxID=6303 RepID=A0A915LZZ0_MELJA